MKKYILTIVFLVLMLAIYNDQQPLSSDDYMEILEEHRWLKEYYKVDNIPSAPRAIVSQGQDAENILKNGLLKKELYKLAQLTK